MLLPDKTLVTHPKSFQEGAAAALVTGARAVRLSGGAGMSEDCTVGLLI